MARTRFQGGKRRGRLRGRDVFKAAVQDTDKIFRQRVVKFNPKSTSALVLTDFSGSMGGDKMECATVATHELSRVMHALMVPHSVHSFSTQSRMHTKMFTFKKYGESFNSEEFLKRCVHASHHMHCNADGDVLLWAGRELLKRKTARKILFVLSDGSPAATDAHGNRGCMQWTQKVAKDLERMGIEVFAIGIEDRNVDKIYKHRATIANAKDLEPALLGIMRNKLLSAMT
jgi:cobaltochelatase CobT